MKIKIWAAVCALMALSACAVSAADVRISGVIFADHTSYLGKTDYNNKPSRGVSAFSVSRAYLNAESRFGDKLKGKVTLEGNTTASSDTAHGSNPVFLKYAYGEYSFASWANVTFGLIPGAWNGYEEKIWDRRYVGRLFSDQSGLVQSADKGAGLAGALPGGYGDYHFAYVNGEGTSSPELLPSVDSGKNGRYKDMMLRVSVTPLPAPVYGMDLAGLKIHGYQQGGKAESGKFYDRNRSIIGLSYQAPAFHLMGARVTGSEGNGAKNYAVRGYSLHGHYNLPVKSVVAVFGKYDHFKGPNKMFSVNANTAPTGIEGYSRATIGVDYTLDTGVRLAISDQLFAKTAGSKHNENRLVVSGELKF